MSFASQLRAFATQAAAQRAELFSGPVNGSDKNIQIGATAYKVAFVDEYGRAIEEFGERLISRAVMLIPDSLGVTVTLGLRITHLPSNTVWVVDGAKKHPASVETRVACYREEN
jgi:hypothetical protein